MSPSIAKTCTHVVAWKREMLSGVSVGRRCPSSFKKSPRHYGSGCCLLGSQALDLSVALDCIIEAVIFGAKVCLFSAAWL